MSTQRAQLTDHQPLTRPKVDATAALIRYWESHVTEATAKKDAFLVAMRECGTVLDAAERADINRQTAYLWRRIDPEFRDAWDRAKEDANDKVKRSLYNMATSEKNVVATIFWLKSNCPDYRERIQVDVTAMEREIEDRLDSLPREIVSGQLADSLLAPSPKGLLTEMLTGGGGADATASGDDHNQE
jgi:hypothetical protein